MLYANFCNKKAHPKLILSHRQDMEFKSNNLHAGDRTWHAMAIGTPIWNRFRKCFSLLKLKRNIYSYQPANLMTTLCILSHFPHLKWDTPPCISNRGYMQRSSAFILQKENKLMVLDKLHELFSNDLHLWLTTVLQAQSSLGSHPVLRKRWECGFDIPL